MNRAAWNEVKGLSTEEAKSNYVAAFLAFLERNAGESSDANKALVRYPSLPLSSLSLRWQTVVNEVDKGWSMFLFGWDGTLNIQVLAA
jgi:hypothetical protein